MTFTSYAQGGSFRPKSVTDYLPALKENQARQKRDENVYFNQLRRNDQTRIEEAKRTGDGLIALGKFSGTLADVLAKEAKKKAEEDMNEGIVMAYEEAMFGPGTPERIALDAGEEQLKADDAQIQLAATGVLAMNPENYQAANNVKNLSGWKKYGYATGLAQTAAMNYQPWMENAMRTDDTTQITINGETFTPATAADPAQKQAAMGVLRRQYMAQAGISGLSKPLLAKYTFEEMYKADAAMIGQARKDYAIAQSEIDAGEADNAFLATKDMQTYLDSMSTTVDGQGRMRGYGGAWTEVMSRLETMAAAGLLTEADIRAVEGQIQGDTGKTFGELHRTKFALLRQKIQDAELSNYNRSNEQRKLERSKAETAIIDQLMSQDDITEDDIEAAEEKLDEIYPGVDSTRLNSIKSNQTVEAESLKAQAKEAKELADAGLLTPERLSKFHWSIQQQFSNVAQMQKEAAPALTVHLEAIEDQVKNIAGVTPQSKADGTVTLMVAKAQADLRQIAAKHMANGKSAEDAGLLAYTEINRRLEEGKGLALDQKNNPYASDGTEGYPNLLPSTTDASNAERSAAADIDRIEATANALGGRLAFGKTPGLLFNEEELERFDRDMSNGTFETPARAAHFARVYGFKDPLEIINAQREAAGMEPMNVPASVEAVRQGVNPALQKFLYNYPTEHRQTRALSSIANYNASIVPRGYGDAVQSAAQKHGIDPSILAGLIETESSWNPAAISASGARGLGQFMPATAREFGVDVNDPISSINGAAEYLKYLQDYFKGDMNLAIYAYNGGMGNIEKFGGPIPGNAENQNYLKKVMRGAARYGYGQLPVRHVYTTGNIGPTSTGPHLDVKKVGGGRFLPSDLDKYVIVDDPELGSVPLGQIPVTGDFDSHTARGSHGIDYGTHSGTKIRLRGGAVLVGSRPSIHGDVVTIALPNGEQYTFLHGTKG